jgi:hypothetical protein
MVVTNNFDNAKITDLTELWIKVEEYTLKVFYHDGKSFECVQKAGEPEVSMAIDSDVDSYEDYRYSAMTALKIYARIVKQEEIIFANRMIVFNNDKECKDCLLIQTDHEDEEGNFEIDPLMFDRKKWLEIMTFFEKASILNMKLCYGCEDDD